jgi:dihydroorotate dehydrogenase (NAD+) catalytic subunit
VIRRRARAGAPVDLTSAVGSVSLAAPVLTASGTAGHGTELAPYVDLPRLGAVVVKSLLAREWPGNPAPRLHPVAAGMVNSVGLQGPGVAAWLEHELPPLLDAGATVVASIWGRTVDEYATAAAMLAKAPPGVVAVEVNLSCPNLHGGGMFAQSPEATRAVMEATAVCGRPRWAKLTAAVADVPAVAGAAAEGGAEAVTVINTLPGMVIDVERRRPVLGAGGGGLSGPAIHPVAVRAVSRIPTCRSSAPAVSPTP